ncbi:MAG: hypothetical protein RL238_974 [Actinomycetota bacterium]
MRRSLALLLVVVAVVGVTGCSKSSRGSAKAEFVQQLVDEGGFDQPVAECIADRFFELRTDADLKEFFEREQLTDAEAAEFRSIGAACAEELTPSTTG